ADEEGRLGVAGAEPQVGGEERLERGVDRDGALAAALRLTHAKQAPLEVDVVAAEPEQLAAAQAGVGEEGEQHPVALAPAGMSAGPDVVAFDRLQQPGELAPV